MDGRRRAPDRRSPVQPGKTSVLPFIIVAVVGTGAAWTLLRDNGSSSTRAPVSVGNEAYRVPGPKESSTGPQSARGQISALFSADDYPQDAQIRDEQGTVRVELKIDREGRVSRCNVLASSGSKSLDSATCRILQSRARFTPARGIDGQPTEDTYTQSITWRLEG
jgi:TonB family protein